MDPCPFTRILIGNLAIKFPNSMSSINFCYCKIKFKNYPTQQATIPILQDHQNQNNNNGSLSNSLAACFNLDKNQIKKITSSSKPTTLILEIYTKSNEVSCGFQSGKILDKVTVTIDLKKAENRACVMQNGWISIGDDKKKVEFYLCVRVEPDPRYVFQFGGDPECSPQVFQVQGNVRQAVFTCKFNLRNPGDRQSMLEPSTSRNWLGGEKEQCVKERKGWTVTIHDLSGSPVAMASMVTPFVPSPGSDRVSRSNPGAWLILRPSLGTWKPWGRLEAWREPKSNELGYKFELIHDTATATPTTTVLTNSIVNIKNGGKFTIDTTNSVTTPISSPHSSCDFGSGTGSGSWSGSEFGMGLLSQFMYRGFVMSSTIKGGNKNSSKAEVEIGVQHVNCTEDAAAFVALAAAMDLSMDACKLFSHKLRKELRQQSQSFVV